MSADVFYERVLAKMSGSSSAGFSAAARNVEPRSLNAEGSMLGVRCWEFYALAEAAVQGGEGEVFAGADSLFAFDFAVSGEADFALEDGALKPVDEEGEGLKLFAGGAFDLEVADKADADGDEVELVVFDVPALELAGPAGADFDLSVARVDAVADDEVVGESVLHAAFAVGASVGFGVAFFNGAVVSDDGLPIRALHVDAGGLGTHGAEGVEVRGGLRGNDEFLTDLDEVRAQVVTAFQGRDGRAVALGEAAEGVAAFDGVDARAGSERFGKEGGARGCG